MPPGLYIGPARFVLHSKRVPSRQNIGRLPCRRVLVPSGQYVGPDRFVLPSKKRVVSLAKPRGDRRCFLSVIFTGAFTFLKKGRQGRMEERGPDCLEDDISEPDCTAYTLEPDSEYCLIGEVCGAPIVCFRPLSHHPLFPFFKGTGDDNDVEREDTLKCCEDCQKDDTLDPDIDCKHGLFGEVCGQLILCFRPRAHHPDWLKK